MKLAFTSIVALAVAIAWCVSAPAQSRVPAWDARGVGLPEQGIACIDVAPDGTFAVGTFASPCDPNVFQFDATGKLVKSFVIGQRAIAQVALNEHGQLHALCTMPEGKASDGPTAFACDEPPVAIPNTLGEAGYPRTIFHYAHNSNHTGVQLVSTREGNVVLYGNQLQWLGEAGKPAAFTTYAPWPSDSVATVLAAHYSSGAVVAGYSVLRSSPSTSVAKTSLEPNLFLMAPGEKQPRLQRPAEPRVGNSLNVGPGSYGRPTTPYRDHYPLDQHDVPVVAPLSIALSPGKTLARIATAEYPGYQRWIRSSATGRDQNYGTCFKLAPPSIHVYDSEGNLLRRFDPEKFPSCWVDLAFLPGDRYLLASPHSWTCRGLGGQPRLPVDTNSLQDTAWLLDTETGDVRSLKFPDKLADAAVSSEGRLAFTCWDGYLYLLTADQFREGKLTLGFNIGGPALVRSSNRDGGWIVAGASGLIQIFDKSGRTLHETNLSDGTHTLVKSQPWVKDAKAEKIADGLWQLPGGRVESDLAGQWVIEGPDGLILIEGHGGLSIERERQAMRAVGLDPDRVKYVLGTHEHGDHSPGAYLWRVMTGAQFVCSPQMEYVLRHHIPQCSGYGLHPPVPADIHISDPDKELDLCGVKVRALTLSGHTYGSMGWLVERGGKKYMAIGDLIMPDGVLGYAGSINFSARDVLSSLGKVDRLKVDYILPGHGPVSTPERYIAAGIGVGRHVGWGKFKPDAPDPRYRLKQENVIVAAWNLDQTSADFGDLNGDGLPDVVVACGSGSTTNVKVFLNQKGKFEELPHRTISVDVVDPTKIRLRDLNGDKRLDVFVSGQSSALLLSKNGELAFDTLRLSLNEGNQARRVDLGDGKTEIVVNAKFGEFARVGEKQEKMTPLQEMLPKVSGPYADLFSGDVNGDGRSDLVSSYGHVYLRGGDGKLPAEPTLKLPAAKGSDWSYFAVGDFNGDRRTDLTFFTAPQEVPEARIYYNTGDAAAPYALEPSARLDLADPPAAKKNQHPLLRDTVVAADWNGDGVQDLVIGKGQDKAITILPGGPKGIDFERRIRLALDYRLHYETGLFVGDFNGDGKADVACLGDTNTGVGAGGPPAVYVYLQQ